MRYRLSLAMLLLFASACEHSTEPAVPSALAASGSTNLAAVAGSPVSPAPSVVVKDQHGSPMSGVAVTWTVTSGGGSVSGSAVTTGADGTAAAGTWILGTAAGPNVLTASSGTLTPVTFSATGTAGPPSSAVRAAGDNQVVTVASVTPIAPSVSVKDAYGNPAPGVTVVFAVGLGGGTLTGASQTTGADGIATVGSWKIGTVSGLNTVTATAGALPTTTFVVTGIAGAATQVIKVAGDNQTGRAGTVVHDPIVARVTDAYGNGKPNFAVNFAVTGGGGSIAGPAGINTDQSGYAVMYYWLLGPNAGQNSLSATATGIGTVTFTVSGLSNDCNLDAIHTIGTTSTGALTSADCVAPAGQLIDYYRFAAASASSIEIRETSSVFDAYLYFTASDGTALAESDDDDSSSNSRLKLLLPSGSYRIGASSFDQDETGSYTVSTATVSQSEDNCDVFWVVVGITTDQSINNNDCASNVNNTLHADLFAMKLRGGTVTSIRMSSTAVDPYLELYGFDGLIATSANSISTPRTAEIRYGPLQDTYVYIAARTVTGLQAGAYTLSVVPFGAGINSRASVEPGQPVRTLQAGKAKPRIPWVKQ